MLHIVSNARPFPFGAIHPLMERKRGTAGAPNQSPVAAFGTSMALRVLTVTDSSSDPDGSIASWDWDWGDSTTHGTGQVPGTHTYSASGSYTVTLTVTDNLGATNSISHSVTAHTTPTAAFGTSMALRVLTVTDSSSADAAGSATLSTWDWDWGDGTSHGSGQNPGTHTYSTSGSKSVVLTVTDSYGVTNQVTHSVTAHVAPTASFTTSTTLLAVTPTDTSTADTTAGATITGWDWDWGDSTSHGAVQSPGAHNYTTNGSKTITLTVTDSFGVTAQATASVSPDITKDGPSSAKRVPLSSGDWTAIGQTAAQDLYLLQEASGNVADSIGALTLTANGSPSYQNAVTSWTRKSINLTDASSTMNLTVGSGSGGNPSSTSVAYGAYVKFTGTPGSTRDVMGVGSGTGVKVQVLNTGKLRISCNAVTTDSTSTYLDSNVHFLLLVYDRTHSTVKLYIDSSEVVTGTYSSGATDSTKGFGKLNATAPPGAYLWGFMASGSTAESYGAATATALGW